MNRRMQLHEAETMKMHTQCLQLHHNNNHTWIVMGPVALFEHFFAVLYMRVPLRLFRVHRRYHHCQKYFYCIYSLHSEEHRSLLGVIVYWKVEDVRPRIGGKAVLLGRGHCGPFHRYILSI